MTSASLTRQAAPGLRDAMHLATSELARSGVDTPALDARLLAAHAFGCDAAALIRHAEEPADASGLSLYRALIRRRVAREPVSRILGRREFYGRAFHLSEHVLDPRPDSETLITEALDIRASGTIGERPRILDLGTGSGALLVTLLAEWPDATGVGADIVPGALATARRNAERHGVAGRCMLVASDWDRALAGRFDLIVANPPYLARRELDALEPEVAGHDPESALDGGLDGLDAHRHVMAAAGRLLDRNHGRLLLEIGADQGRAVRELARDCGFGDVAAHAVRRDLGGRDRIVCIRVRRPAGIEK